MTGTPPPSGAPGRRARAPGWHGGGSSAQSGGSIRHGGGPSAQSGGSIRHGGGSMRQGGGSSPLVGQALELNGGLASTVALAGITIVTGIDMGRLFLGASYLAPVLVMAVLSHVLAFGLRKAKRFPPVLVAPVCLVVFVLVATWLVFPGATALGFPDLHTLHVISDSLSKAQVDFATLAAPVPAFPGFLWLAALAIAAAGALADAAAFRLGAPVEGILPAFAVFLFTAGLGTTNGHSAAVGIWLAAVLAYLLVVEVERRCAAASWMSNGAPPSWSAFPAGAALAALAVLGALLIGPMLPGAHGGSLFASATTSPSTPSQQVTISPLVDIKSELLKPSTATVFTVRSPVPSYWQLTALDTFNGTVWSADNSYQPAGPALPRGPGSAPAESVTQEFDITGLDEDWLPAAYRPVALSGVTGASFNQATASIIAPKPTYRGESYTVLSDIPQLTAAELSTAKVNANGPGISQDLELPASFPTSVRQLAQSVTKGAATPYAKALALQDYFRDSFTYSLNVPASNSDSALVTFLFDTRKGYCQQFAGAFAAMARAVGLPTRVAVGFTQGQVQSNGTYKVEALDAHAWPEVELGNYGWIAFEPTPGRGEPGTTSYTGVAPAQAKPKPAAATHPGATTPATTAVTTAPPATSTQPSSPATVPPKATKGAAHPSGAHSLGALAILGLVLAGLVMIFAVALGALATLGVARRRRRWAGSAGPETVLVAFADAAEVLAWSGRPRHPAETFVVYAQRVAPDLPPGATSSLIKLARYAEQAAYAQRSTRGDWPSVGALREMVEEISSTIRRSITFGRRMLWWVDPRARLGHKQVPDWAPRDSGPLVREPLHRSSRDP